MPSGRLHARPALALCHLLCVFTLAAAQDYEVPQPIIEALHPKGLKVSIPDSDGVQLFAFHGNVNRPLYNLEAGEMSVDITRKTNGLWTYHNKLKRLKVGDVINFWLYVQVDGRGYRLDDQTYTISELIDTNEHQPTPSERPTQRPSGGTSGNNGNPNSNNEYGSSSGLRPDGLTDYRPTGTVYKPPTEEYRPQPESRPDVYRPPETSRPSDVYRPPETSRPGNVHRPPETSRPSDVYRPPETSRPSDAYRPPETSRPSDVYRPSETSRPGNVHRPLETSRPSDVYRPPETSRPSDVYRPPETSRPSDVYRPQETSRPSDVYRPPETSRPSDVYRPPETSRPSDVYRPPEASRPSDVYRPPETSRPSDVYRPPETSRPSVANRPLPIPPQQGSRPAPPPPPAHNHEYPPPPPPSGVVDVQGSTVIHNHHVGFAGSNNHNYQTGADRYPHETANNNNHNQAQSAYPANNRPTSTLQGTTSNNNNNNNYNENNVGSRPTYAERPTLGGGDDDRPSFSGAAGQGGVIRPGLPLNGDGFTEQSGGVAGGGLGGAGANCELAVTTVNGRPACKGQVVFEEEWGTLNLRRWEHEVKISGSPDFEFCIYAQHPENTFVRDGRLHVKPTLTNDKYGADFIRKGKLQLDDCTGGPVNSDSCTREAMFSYILPPVLASRLTTKSSFSFKYGKIDIRAKLPKGDWIYPEIWLQPRREEYGPGLSSGRVHLAMSRGNRELRASAPESEDLSGRLLVVGALAGGNGVGSGAARRKFFTRRADRGLWADRYHNYTLLWTPETLAFSVDGVELGVARPEEFGGLLHGRANEDDPWSSGTKMAPFDKEFYISLGTAVGGIHAFPDGCKSNSHEKPWKNTGAKAMLSFWNAKNNWYPTWNEDSEMLIESVRVTALNN